MTATVCEHILRRLHAWGVDHVFGCPGDGVDALLAACDRTEDGPRLVRSPHARTSAFQAVGHARFGERPGVCAAASGPDAIHLLGGLYDAKLDRVPVLAIVGRRGTGRDDPQRPDIDPYVLFRDVASEFLETVTTPQELPDLLDRALRTASARRCPVVVVVPEDVQELDCPEPPGPPETPEPAEASEASEPPAGFRAAPAGPGQDQGAAVPSARSLERAAEILNSGDKVAILVGRGAAGASAEVRRIAELLGAGVAKELLGKDVIGDELPYVTGTVGPLGTRPSYELMRDCDTLLTIGSSFTHPRFLPEPGRARSVRIDVEPGPIGAGRPSGHSSTDHAPGRPSGDPSGNPAGEPSGDPSGCPYEVELVADVRETLGRLIPTIRSEERGREWFTTVCDNVRRWDEVLDRRSRLSADPINPERVARVLDALLPPDAIVACDSGSVTAWYARHLTMRPGMRGALSGGLAATGCAVPYAIGAKFAHPDRPVIALVGDGAMQPDGLTELITAARYRDLWQDPRLVVAVWNDRGPDRGATRPRDVADDPALPSVPTRLSPDVPYAAFARSLGLTGVRVETPEEVEPGWRAALAAEGPAVVEFLTDPTVPPVPAHATWEQLGAAAAAVLKGEPDAGSVVRHAFKAKMQEFLPDPRTE
ncbi:thiamine pyrophosphate-dependent enzyme [Streptomyces hayashii]|uniref:thiamine pyrophosphate-dependent enzyme n=1 Tax=Streptomyces hayashii TaxID=2839966 RepID=UPI00403C3D33